MKRLKVKTKTKITPKDLIEFCSKEVHSETVFEKINHIYTVPIPLRLKKADALIFYIMTESK